MLILWARAAIEKYFTFGSSGVYGLKLSLKKLVVRLEYAGESISDNISDVKLDGSDGRDWRMLRRVLSFDADVEVGEPGSDDGILVDAVEGVGEGKVEDDWVSSEGGGRLKSGELKEYGIARFSLCEVLVGGLRCSVEVEGNGKGRGEPIPIFAMHQSMKGEPL